MRLQLTQGELARFSPAEPGLHAHCVRVSALVSEIGRTITIPLRSAMVLQQAALIHHCVELIPGDAAAGRLLADVFADAVGAWKPTGAPESLASVLQAFHCFPERTGDAMGDLLGEILALANVIDEQIEGAAMDGATHAALWKNLEALRGMFTDKLWLRARELFPAAIDSQRTWEIPVQPDVAQHLAGFLRQPAAYSLSRLAEIANRDPATAGRLIQAANSPLFSARMRIGSVRHALAYLGENASRRIVTALMARSMFGSSGTLRRLWEHSLKNRPVSGKHGAGGGLHGALRGPVDWAGSSMWGRIALVRQKEAAALGRLTAAGGVATWAETLLYGVDHAELGARILESWRFPEGIVEAVRFHHLPAESMSRGAAALYAAEFGRRAMRTCRLCGTCTPAYPGSRFAWTSFTRFEALDAAVGALLKIA